VVSPQYHLYVEHWPGRPSSAAAAHTHQHYCVARPGKPLPDKYTLAPDKQMTERTDKPKDSQLRKAPLCGRDSIRTEQPPERFQADLYKTIQLAHVKP